MAVSRPGLKVVVTSLRICLEIGGGLGANSRCNGDDADEGGRAVVGNVFDLDLARLGLLILGSAIFTVKLSKRSVICAASDVIVIGLS